MPRKLPLKQLLLFFALVSYVLAPLSSAQSITPSINPSATQSSIQSAEQSTEQEMASVRHPTEASLIIDEQDKASRSAASLNADTDVQSTNTINRHAGPIIVTPKPRDDASLKSSAFKAVGGLVVIVLMVYGLAWALRRFGHRGYGFGRSMKIVEVLPVGAREKAVLIDVSGRKILIGVGTGNVSSLHVFEDEFMFDKDSSVNLNGDKQLSANSTAEFSKKLNAFLSGSYRTSE